MSSRIWVEKEATAKFGNGLFLRVTPAPPANESGIFLQGGESRGKRSHRFLGKCDQLH